MQTPNFYAIGSKLCKDPVQIRWKRKQSVERESLLGKSLFHKHIHNMETYMLRTLSFKKKLRSHVDKNLVAAFQKLTHSFPIHI